MKKIHAPHWELNPLRMAVSYLENLKAALKNCA